MCLRISYTLNFHYHATSNCSWVLYKSCTGTTTVLSCQCLVLGLALFSFVYCEAWIRMWSCSKLFCFMGHDKRKHLFQQLYAAIFISVQKHFSCHLFIYILHTKEIQAKRIRALIGQEHLKDNAKMTRILKRNYRRTRMLRHKGMCEQH